MDKHTKDANNPGFSTDSPKPSNVDSMIEQFKVDISKKSHDDFKEARTLTIEPHKLTPEADIDRQISELEDMIKQLQEEIEEMSQNADKKAEEEYTIVTKKSSHKMGGPATVGHVYPIILKDVGMNLHEHYQAKDSDDRSPDSEHLTDISKNFKALWNDDTPEDQKEADDADSSIDRLIEELQAELIAEKMNKPDEDEEAGEKSSEETILEGHTNNLINQINPNLYEHFE